MPLFLYLTVCPFVPQPGKHSRVYCTASFSINFPHDADVCYLAFHYPYTYTRLRVRCHQAKLRFQQRLTCSLFLFCRNVQSRTAVTIF